jgi:putative transposase
MPVLSTALQSKHSFDERGLGGSMAPLSHDTAGSRSVFSDVGAVLIDIPQDRDGSFEPELIRKGQTRIDGMDDKIIGLYEAGLSIRAHLEQIYGLKVSANLIRQCH